MRHKQRQAPYFRWHILNWAQRTAATLAVVIAICIVGLIVYSYAIPVRAEGVPGRPHAPAPLAIFVRPSPTPKPSVPTPTPFPTPFIPRVGIVSGHRGNDSGAVCKDGLTEAQVNYDLASRVAAEMRQHGYRVDLFDEFDARLNNYRALLVLSIHADSCDYINSEATGFKVARALDSRVPEQEDRLVKCIADRYAVRTGMHFHQNSVTPDMTNYHGFYEIAPDTPAAIIETGFLYLDRSILTQRADLVAQGIVDGLTCYLSARGAP